MRSFWRSLHLYLGLAASLPLLVIAGTGVLLAFGPYLQAWTTPDVYGLAGAERQDAPSVLREVRAQYPEVEVHHLSMFQEERRTWIGYVSRGDDHFQLRVDPTTARVTPVRTPGWMATVEHLHRTLTLGTAGRWVVGASTGMLVVLLLSGAYLWLPMWAGTVRQWLRRGTALGWHNAVGLLALPLLLVMGVTGLTLTFAPALVDGVFAVTGSPPLPSPPAVPADGDSVTVSLAEAAEAARAAHPGASITAVQQGGPSSPHEVHLARPGALNPHGWLRLWVDPHTGRILQTLDTYAHSAGSVYKHSWWGWHTGAFFGLGGRVLWAAVVLLLPVLVGTGAYRWWRRRRARTRTQSDRASARSSRSRPASERPAGVVPDGPDERAARPSEKAFEE